LSKLTYKGLVFITRTGERLVFLYLFLFVLVLGLQMFADADRFSLSAWLIQAVDKIEKPALEFIRDNMPTKFKGLDVARWIFVAGLVLIWLQFINVGGWLESRMLRRPEPPPMPSPQPKDRPTAQPTTSSDAFDPNIDREKLLEIYTQSKKSLDMKRRRVAFLSLDVVGSTEMKRGEDPGVVERDFRRYRRLVEQVIEKNNALKAAWTPDGVMICFGSVQDAVTSAQALIRRLGDFNRQTKTIRENFAVRAGIHAGEILFDDTVGMEQISDLAIDITGHMQKYAAPNSISLGQELLGQLDKPKEFQSAGREVDGLVVCEWRMDAESAGS
jgi:class 3 adenylate cyclase/uncharacterized protein YggT (Ycf19 family)